MVDILREGSLFDDYLRAVNHDFSWFLGLLFWLGCFFGLSHDDLDGRLFDLHRLRLFHLNLRHNWLFDLHCVAVLRRRLVVLFDDRWFSDCNCCFNLDVLGSWLELGRLCWQRLLFLGDLSCLLLFRLELCFEGLLGLQDCLL